MFGAEKGYMNRKKEFQTSIKEEKYGGMSVGKKEESTGSHKCFAHIGSILVKLLYLQTVDYEIARY